MGIYIRYSLGQVEYIGTGIDRKELTYYIVKYICIDAICTVICSTYM